MAFNVPCSECGIEQPLHVFSNLTDLVCEDCLDAARLDHVEGDEPDRLPD